MSFRCLSDLSVFIVVCVPALSPSVSLGLRFALKRRKQRKEQSHAQCHVTHRIRNFDQIFENFKFSKLANVAVPEGSVI